MNNLASQHRNKNLPYQIHWETFTDSDNSLENTAESVYESLECIQSLQGNPRQAMELVRITLYNLHKNSSPSQWRQIVDDVLLNHPLKDYCHRDPFTYRSFSKPRGYAGDAVTLDYIYGLNDLRELDSEIDAAIHSVSMNSPSTRAVRNRLAFIVNKLTDLVQTRKNPDVLSVACGHCREAEFASVPIASLGRFIAIDHDQESLELVEKEYGMLGVTPLRGSISTLIKPNGVSGSFDLIYGLGIYDYLNQRTARKLTASLFDRLKPGGELVIGNFKPRILDIGYMESYMAWELVYRDANQMADLVFDIDQSEVYDQRIEEEPEGNIVLLSLKRK